MAMRTPNGNATSSSIAQQTPINHPNQSTAARGDGLISIRLQKCAAECRVLRIAGYVTGDEITRDFGVRQFEKLDERSLFFACCVFESFPQITCQQQV